MANGGPLGFEDTLWKAADKLRGSMDASEYKHVVLGLIFLKYIDDAFTERRATLEADLATDGITGADALELLESRDEYMGEGIFWVPRAARWTQVQSRAKQPGVGRVIDQAMDAVEAENPTLKGVLPKNFARPSLDPRRLGELVDLISGLGLGGAEHREKDLLGRVYEYFLGRFASAEGKGGGEFYTPRHVVQTLVEMIEPYGGRVYDPCCGSGGMFVQSELFMMAHGGKRGDLSVYGQELNDTTWRLAKMNLAIRGIDADLGPRWGDTFHDDLHPGLKADYILANPPFNISDWGGDQLRDDPRWKYGPPPTGNANYAWLQHMASKLSPRGVAGIVLANGSLSTQTSNEGEIRRKMIEDDLVECIVSLPGQLFYSTQIPVSSGCSTATSRTAPSGAIGVTAGARSYSLMPAISATWWIEPIESSAARTSPRSRAHTTLGGANPTPVPMKTCPGSAPRRCESRSPSTASSSRPGATSGSEAAVEDDEPVAAKIARLKQKLYQAFEESNQLQERVRTALERLHG